MTDLTTHPDGEAPVDEPGTVLSIDGLSKSYGPVKALLGASFTVRSGEVLGLLGDNGAGKTTLVKCLSGIIKPDAGEVRINGELVHIDSPKQARALGIETVHQDLALIDTLDVTGNLFLNREELTGRPLRWLGFIKQRQMHRDAKNILDSLKINIPSVRYPIERLSGGQRQAVAVGRAVAWGQRIVLMDEPSAALGVEQTRLVLELIQTLRERNILVVLISHNMQNVLDVCTRAVVLRHGSVVADVPIADVTARDLIDHITGTG
jgi:simple sugar transport system ATP-binding protein